MWKERQRYIKLIIDSYIYNRLPATAKDRIQQSSFLFQAVMVFSPRAPPSLSQQNQITIKQELMLSSALCAFSTEQVWYGWGLLFKSHKHISSVSVTLQSASQSFSLMEYLHYSDKYSEQVMLYCTVYWISFCPLVSWKCCVSRTDHERKMSLITNSATCLETAVKTTSSDCLAKHRL